MKPPIRTLTAAGYIVADNSTIYGAGTTEDAALADARQWMHRSDDGTDPTEGAHRGIGRIAGRLYVAPATSALIDYVTSYAHGGAPVWADRDGICCTQDEADA